jgi:hypothetical protein
LKARAGAALVALAVAGLAGACQTVDLGTPPADINACRPSQTYFAQTIWTTVLSKDYGGKHCFDSNCHDQVGKGSLALIPNPMPVMDPTVPPPLPLPPDWAANYRSTTEVMNCSDVTASKLILYPTGMTSHGGGTLFNISSPEAQAIEMWVTAP